MSAKLERMGPEDEERIRLAEDLAVHQEELRVQHEQLKQAQRELEQSRDQYAELYDFAPVAYLTLDKHGVVEAINLTGCAFLELERAKVLRLPLSWHLISSDHDRLAAHLRECLASSLSVFAEVTLQTSSGRRVPVQLTSKRVSSVPGTLVRTALTDLTHRKRAEAEIRQLNISLEQRVAQRTAELEQATEALREADRSKDQFLAMLGHELRNPLGPIRNALEVWRVSDPDPADPCVSQMRDVLDRQVAHMSRIIDDLLDVSRISRGKVELRCDVLDLVCVVESTVSDLRSEIERAGLSLELECGHEPLWVRADATRLSQALINLLNNARKFTDRGGSIQVRVSQGSDQRACISVRDTGIGIAPPMLPRVFDAFSQADSTLDRSRGGLGLGLSLVRGLVELHGGDVYASSGGLGAGAEFTVCLPLAEPPAASANHRDLSESPAAPQRILVIDDGRDTVLTMQTLLKKLGHEVAVAYDGEVGLETARTFQPDVIFCDIGLPGIDGYEVARRLRQDPQLQGLHLVAVTGYGKSEDRQHAREAGFDAHLTKPIALADLRRLLSARAVGIEGT